MDLEPAGYTGGIEFGVVRGDALALTKLLYRSINWSGAGMYYCYFTKGG